MKHSAAFALLILTLASPVWTQMLPRPATLVIKSVPSGAPVALNGSTRLSRQTYLWSCRPVLTL
jgi:hypothetical protein